MPRRLHPPSPPPFGPLSPQQLHLPLSLPLRNGEGRTTKFTSRESRASAWASVIPQTPEGEHVRVSVLAMRVFSAVAAVSGREEKIFEICLTFFFFYFFFSLSLRWVDTYVWKKRNFEN